MKTVLVVGNKEIFFDIPQDLPAFIERYGEEVVLNLAQQELKRNASLRARRYVKDGKEEKDIEASLSRYVPKPQKRAKASKVVLAQLKEEYRKEKQR